MPEHRLSELCKIFRDQGFEAQLDGQDRAVSAVNTLENAQSGEITFLSNPRYTASVATTKASAVILKDGLDVPDGLSAIRCADPYAAITMAIIKLHGHRQHPRWSAGDGASSVTIAPSAQIGADANIAPGATIAEDVTIGDRCTFYPGCYVGTGVKIGHDCVLYPNVVIYDYCELGDRVTIHAGTVVGEDGLGYAPLGDRWIKIPQVGRAVLGDDVEIGANCTIDRATLGQTEIGAGTKFGNVVVIGHGSKIGPNCMFVGLIGVAGSVKMGCHVTVAGQAGIAGHLSIGDNAKIGGGSAVHGDIPAGATHLGTPAVESGQAKRIIMAGQKLPEWIKRVRALEREVEQLRSLVNSCAAE